ncbi:MAG: hypothetical protein FWH51_04000 [Dehalococcoidia bacterium]|nr:hypothetical protein [Dehalococcoidia bacterium]
MASDDSYRWMPTASGVLNIVSGILGIFSSLVLLIVAAVFQYIYKSHPISIEGDPEVFPLVASIFVFVGLVIIIPCIVSVVGGICSLKRKRWGWALAGSICSVLASNVLGIVAIIFIVMSKKEFDTGTNPQSEPPWNPPDGTNRTK